MYLSILQEEVDISIDRAKRLAPTFMAVCVLLLLGFGVNAADSPPTVGQADQSGSAKTGGAARYNTTPPQATLALTWRVPYAHESNDVNGAFCSTAVVVQTPGSAPSGTAYSSYYEMEWLDDWGNSLVYFKTDLCVGCRYTVIADDDIAPFWTVVDRNLNLDNFTGRVNVHGDPRLVVSAFEWCRSAAGPGGTLVAVNDIPAYPVGAALNFFQARMPATWTPPMAEVPD